MPDSKGELKRYETHTATGDKDEECYLCKDVDTALSTAEQRIEELEKECNLAIAHDTQPYPTAEAYELVCAALNKKTTALSKAEATIAELRGEREKELRRFFDEGLIYRSMMPHSTTTAESKWFEKFLAQKEGE